MNDRDPSSNEMSSELQQLASPAPGLTIYRAHLEQTEDAMATLGACLSAVEWQRANRFGTPLLRLRYVVGRALLRRALGSALGIAPRDVAIEAGRRGRPRVRGHDVDFNVTHTCATALIGIVQQGHVGIDIESGDRRVNVEGIARKFMTARERPELAELAGEDDRRRALLRLWTCKEALSKATGDALSAPFRKLEVAVGRVPRLLAGPAPYRPTDWQMFDVPLPDDYFASVGWWQTNALD